MTDLRKIDALVAEPKPYQCRKCGGSDHFVSGEERRRVCRPCAKASGDRWRRANPQKHNNRISRNSQKEAYKSYRRQWALKNRYGISPQDYESLLASQGGGCAICGVTSSRNRLALPVDHCHASGAVRGILCDGCNIGLASFGDDCGRMLKAIGYLQDGALKAKGVEVEA